jgi:hypothetical protein
MFHKPQALLIPGALVKIAEHRRQVGGEFAHFLDLFWREDEPWVVLQLPNGQRAALPASWTDLPRGCFVANKGRAELLPSALLELARYCQRLTPQRPKRPRPKRSPRDNP